MCYKPTIATPDVTLITEVFVKLNKTLKKKETFRIFNPHGKIYAVKTL
jgi:hypothetical protein